MIRVWSQLLHLARASLLHQVSAQQRHFRSFVGASRWLAALQGASHSRVVPGQAPRGHRLAYSFGNGARQFRRRRPNYSFKPNPLRGSA
jgi:hypothetical protein